jgi:archaellum biogenesis ATPase FlaH
MIEFPETAQREWDAIHAIDAARVEFEKNIRADARVDTELENIRVRHRAKILHEQELSADQTPTLEMGTLANHLANPVATPQDIIEGVLKDNGLLILLGPSSAGKSTLALQMLYCAMTGDPWLGQPVKPIMGSVGVLSYDMDAGLVYDWMAGYPNLDPNKVGVVNAHKQGNPLAVPEFRKRIASAWKSMGVEIVVIDSFSASFFGHDQNDAASTMAHYRELKAFALRECGARAVVIIAHSTPDSPNKARGSTVHHDVADSIVAMEVDGKTGTRYIRMVKYRAGRGQHQMHEVAIGEPDDVTHLVDLDLGAMTLKGLKLPTTVAAMFPDDPATIEDPDTSLDATEIDEETL